jgi:hypothetical protein
MKALISTYQRFMNGRMRRRREHVFIVMIALLYTRYQYLMAIQHTNTDNHFITQVYRSPVSVYDLNLSVTLLLFGDVII